MIKWSETSYSKTGLCSTHALGCVLTYQQFVFSLNFVVLRWTGENGALLLYLMSDHELNPADKLPSIYSSPFLLCWRRLISLSFPWKAKIYLFPPPPPPPPHCIIGQSGRQRQGRLGLKNTFLPLIRISKMAACVYRLIRCHTSASA